MRTYQYFPGCSLKGQGRAYEESLLEVLKTLDVELKELDDWNCCGATAYMSVDEDKTFALSGRNLAIAERGEGDVMAPCNACYLALNKTKHCLEELPQVAERVVGALDSVGLKYQGTRKVRHPLDVLMNDVGLNVVKQKITKPLKGLKIVPYYGCQIVRPYAPFDSQQDPTTMDQLLTLTGAEILPFPLKTRCCGGSETGTLPEVGLHLVYLLLKEARRRGADVIATICPLCQFNLEAYQDRIAKMFEPVSIPVLYFTQILGVAMGLSAQQMSLHRSLVKPQPVLARLG